MSYSNIKNYIKEKDSSNYNKIFSYEKFIHPDVSRAVSPRSTTEQKERDSKLRNIVFIGGDRYLNPINRDILRMNKREYVTFLLHKGIIEKEDIPFVMGLVESTQFMVKTGIKDVQEVKASEFDLKFREEMEKVQIGAAGSTSSVIEAAKVEATEVKAAEIVPTKDAATEIVPTKDVATETETTETETTETETTEDVPVPVTFNPRLSKIESLRSQIANLCKKDFFRMDREDFVALSLLEKELKIRVEMEEELEKYKKNQEVSFVQQVKLRPEKAVDIREELDKELREYKRLQFESLKVQMSEQAEEKKVEQKTSTKEPGTIQEESMGIRVSPTPSEVVVEEKKVTVSVEEKKTPEVKIEEKKITTPEVKIEEKKVTPIEEKKTLKVEPKHDIEYTCETYYNRVIDDKSIFLTKAEKNILWEHCILLEIITSNETINSDNAEDEFFIVDLLKNNIKFISEVMGCKKPSLEELSNTIESITENVKQFNRLKHRKELLYYSYMQRVEKASVELIVTFKRRMDSRIVEILKDKNIPNDKRIVFIALINDCELAMTMFNNFINEISPEKCAEALSTAVSSLKSDKKDDVIKQMKDIIDKNATKLNEKPIIVPSLKDEKVVDKVEDKVIFTIRPAPIGPTVPNKPTSKLPDPATQSVKLVYGQPLRVSPDPYSTTTPAPTQSVKLAYGQPLRVSPVNPVTSVPQDVKTTEEKSVPAYICKCSVCSASRAAKEEKIEDKKVEQKSSTSTPQDVKTTVGQPIPIPTCKCEVCLFSRAMKEEKAEQKKQIEDLKQTLEVAGMKMDYDEKTLKITLTDYLNCTLPTTTSNTISPNSAANKISSFTTTMNDINKISQGPKTTYFTLSELVKFTEDVNNLVALLVTINILEVEIPDNLQEIVDSLRPEIEDMFEKVKYAVDNHILSETGKYVVNFAGSIIKLARELDTAFTRNAVKQMKSTPSPVVTPTPTTIPTPSPVTPTPTVTPTVPEKKDVKSILSKMNIKDFLVNKEYSEEKINSFSEKWTAPDATNIYFPSVMNIRRFPELQLAVAANIDPEFATKNNKWGFYINPEYLPYMIDWAYDKTEDLPLNSLFYQRNLINVLKNYSSDLALTTFFSNIVTEVNKRYPGCVTGITNPKILITAFEDLAATDKDFKLFLFWRVRDGYHKTWTGLDVHRDMLKKNIKLYKRELNKITVTLAMLE